MDLTGQHLGKYELLERVGQGGMAFVYRAYQPTIDRRVAVKVLHSHLADDATFLERFRREAKGLGSLRHPHIVSVIDFDVHDGWYYMVMDFIEGETLQAMLERRGRLPVDEALHLAAQLAGALDYAHRRGLIHRDVKPGNIMFADNAAQHPVLTDFGLTRLLDNASITISGAIAGTPAYMSPEAAQGEKVDARGDIYSLGVVLYEMVTGQQPYRGETPLSVIMKLVLEPLPPARSINPDLSPAVEAIIAKATAKKPQERYQSAKEMEEVLRAAAAESGEEGGNRKLKIGDWVDEERTLVSPPLPPPATPAPTAVSPPREPHSGTRLRWLPLLSLAALLVVTLVVGFFLLNGGQPQSGPATPAQEAAATDLTPASPTGEPAATQAAPPAPTEEPAPTRAVAAEEPSPAPQIGGALRFTPAGDGSSRAYTLTLENVPPPPAGRHYELWFDIAGRIAPQNAGELLVQDGHIDHAGALANDLADGVGGVRISLEPDFDDDASISGDIAFRGQVEAPGGLDEILLFTVAAVD